MTGAEFKAALAAAGYTQASFANAMGVHRDTIGHQCNSEKVAKYWVSALAGEVSLQAAKTVVNLFKMNDGDGNG